MTTTPDPRPAVVACADGWTVLGHRCRSCSHPTATTPAPATCPACGGDVDVASFGPLGRVWSSTVVRVGVPGRTPPYALAYVDLDDGPRVLAHVRDATERRPVGSAVRVVGHNDEGDLEVEVVT